MNINYADENTVNNIQEVALQETKKIAIEEGIVYRGIKRITDMKKFFYSFLLMQGLLHIQRVLHRIL